MKTHRLLYRSLLIAGLISVVSLANAQDSLNMRITGSYPTNYGGEWNSTVSGNYIYITTSIGAKVVDISNPAVPTASNTFTTGDGSWGVATHNGLLAVSDRSSGSSVFTMSNPTYPTRMTSFTILERVFGVAIADNCICWAADSNGLYISYFDTPTHLNTISHGLPGNTFGVAASGIYAYVLSANTFRVFNISNPASPVVVGSCYISANSDVGGIVVIDSLAYVASTGSGLEIINISNPALPNVLVNYTSNVSGANGIVIAGGLAYLACTSNGVRILDISNPALPVEVGHYTIPMDGFSSIAVSGNYVYSATSARYYAFQYSAPLSVSEPTTHSLPAHFSLTNPYPNPFNVSTLIRFELPQQSFVHVQVFDELGRQVTTLSEGTMSAGSHQLQWNGTNAGSGQYYVRMTAPKFSETKKITLVK